MPERPLSAYGVTYASTAAGRTTASKRAKAPLETSQVFLIPRLGQLDDGGYAFQQWQQHMLSYRRGQYERTVQQNSNSYS